jgi:hypothetical protein
LRKDRSEKLERQVVQPAVKAEEITLVRQLRLGPDRATVKFRIHAVNRDPLPLIPCEHGPEHRERPWETRQQGAVLVQQQMAAYQTGRNPPTYLDQDRILPYVLF